MLVIKIRGNYYLTDIFFNRQEEKEAEHILHGYKMRLQDEVEKKVCFVFKIQDLEQYVFLQATVRNWSEHSS